jgi:uncharacterized protein
MTEPDLPPSERTRVHRYHWLARYDKETVHAILDATPQCAIAYVHEGKPVVTPCLHWREGDFLYWHGARNGRMIKAVDGREVCVAVSLIDGLVCARAAFNFNINHRSVMVYGVPEAVEEPKEKERQLKRLINGLIPRHWDRLRPMTEAELNATAVLRLPLTEASAKVRKGGPEDNESDYGFPVWAGHIPVGVRIDPPVSDPRNLPEIEMPSDVSAFRFG